MPTHAEKLQQELEALELAIAGGVKTVRYADRTVEYQTTNDMIKAADFIKKKLGQGGKTIRLKMGTSKDLD